MRDHIGAQISSPCGEGPIQHSKDADHDRRFPSLLAVCQTKHQYLSQYSHCDATAQSMQLPLQIATKGNFFTETRGNRDRNPKQNFEQAVW